MRRLGAKLGFVHRTLWQRGQTYRWAVLLGPPPLLGCALAALALTAWRHFPPVALAPGSSAPWVHRSRPVPQDDQPYTEAPVAALPQTDASGQFAGLQPGWTGEVRPMSVDATMDVNVVASVLTTFTLDGSTVPLARILDAGPPGGLFVGAVATYFAIRSPGAYAFSARLAWSGEQTANCVVRLISAHHGMVRNVTLNMASHAAVTYAPTEFLLEPGLLLLQAAVGCWRGDRTVGPGTLTLMVRRPGEAVLTPAAADEVMRPVQPGPTTGR